MSTTTTRPEVQPPSLEEFSDFPDPGDPPASKDRVWRDWIVVAVGMSALLSVVGIIISIAALGSSSTITTTVTAPAAASAAANPASATPAAPAPKFVSMVSKTDVEHGKLGPGGTWHDAFVPASFTVRPGQKVTVTVSNYDSSPHSFTSPAMNVNAIVSGGGSSSAPQQSTFTFTAPAKPGAYQWWCSVPCDPFSMTHNGYMRGIVTVRA